MNEIQDKIDSYILGQLTEEERRDFEAQMEKDPELRSQYQYTLTLKKAITSRAEKMKQMQAWDEAESQQQKSIFKLDRKKALLSAASIAAIAIFAIIIFAPNTGSTTLTMPPFTEQSAFRGGIDNTAMQLVSDKHYSEAITEIDKQLAEYETEMASLDTVNAAPEELERINYERALDSEIIEDLNWLKVYALAGNSQQTEAIQLLKSIKEKKGKYSEQADSILKANQ